MKSIIVILCSLLFWLPMWAAKPIEVIIEKITYQIRPSSNDAIVCKADQSIVNASIHPYVEFEGIDYPVVSVIGAFGDCKYLTDIKIPSTVTEIGRFAFGNCTKLERVNLPDSLDIIGECAFWNCKSLKCFQFPKGIQRIEKNAFEGCSQLETVIFNGKVGVIEEEAFYVGSQFQAIGNLKKVCIRSLEDWLAIRFEGFLANNTANPLSNAHADLLIDNEIISILTIPEGIITIGDRVFGGCGSIQSLITPSSLKSIGVAAFADCPNLEFLELGEGIEEIDYYTFYNCPKLNDVKLYAQNPPKLKIGYNLAGQQVNAFADSYPEYMTLHVPNGTRKLYENAEGWKDFGIIKDDLPTQTRIYNSIDDSTNLSVILNLSGQIVHYGNDYFTLPKGMYIIRQGNKTKKIIIQ